MRLTTLTLAAAATLALALYPAQQAKAFDDCTNFEMYLAWAEFKADMCTAVLGDAMCDDESFDAVQARMWRDNVCGGMPPGGGLPRSTPGG
jgi:hypothetical protein